MEEQYDNETHENWNRYKVHEYLTYTLLRYVKRSDPEIFLVHSDLHESNIFVAEKGSVTGIIDWEFPPFSPNRPLNIIPFSSST